MVVTRRRTKAIPIPVLSLYGQALERVEEYKYLRVILTSNLLWSAHINKSEDCGQDKKNDWNALHSLQAILLMVRFGCPY